MFSGAKTQDMHLWQKCHRSAAFSLHSIRWHILIHAITDDVHFGHLILGCLSSFSTVQLLFLFPAFVINI